MGSVQCNAEFEVQLRTGAILEDIERAAAPLRERSGWDGEVLATALSGRPINVWMSHDGGCAGVVVNAIVNRGGLDVLDAVEAFARNIAPFSAEPFVVEGHISGGPDPGGYHRRRVMGASSEEVLEREVADARKDVVDALARLTGLIGRPSGCELAVQDAVALEGLIVAQDQDGEVAALVVASAATSRLSLEDRVVACLMVQALTALAVRGEGGLPFLRNAQAPLIEQPTDLDLAVSRLGEGSWLQTDGPRTGVGNEMWFQCTQTQRTAYVCVDQGRVSCLEVHEPAGDGECHPYKEIPRA